MEDFDVVEPAAAVLVESLRAFGYTPETAIADLIDNSLSAGAKNAWLNFHWSGKDSYIVICDDGRGMSESDLVNAMRPGSQHPLTSRDPKDLGRFGLGLKTASFSQCRCLTVASKTNNSPLAVRRWDLDYLANVYRMAGDSGWRLLRSSAPGSEGHLGRLSEIARGTIVLWERMDRIVGDADLRDSLAQDRFFDTVTAVHEHLAMVFHRYLEGPRPRLSIFINGRDPQHRVMPWDPFLRTQRSTWCTPMERIEVGPSEITVQGFVLPHKDKLGPDLHAEAAGPKGWNAQQGFYVYRNERLLVPGSWLGLGRPRSWTKEEHYKLARILVDIPNSMDGDWHLDVKKSTARPPARIRQRLKGLAEVVRKQARDVFAHRGTYNVRRQSVDLEHLWRPIARDGRTAYRISRDHPLVRSLKMSPSEFTEDLEILLKLLEDTVPVQQIWLDVAERPDTHSRPFESFERLDVIAVMGRVYHALRVVEKLKRAEAIDRLSKMWPFRDYQDLIDSLPDEQE